MQDFKSKKNPDETIHAMVVTSQKIVDIMGKDLSSHFGKYKVLLVNMAPAVTFGPDAVTLVLVGKQENIKNSLDQLKKACFEKEIGLETVPIRSIPPSIKGYLSDMEDKSRFEKIFSFCQKDYLKWCNKNKVNPHPEVIE